MPITSERRFYADSEPAPRAALASESRDTGSDTAAVGGAENARRLVATLNVTDKGAAGVLDVSLEESIDGTNWDSVGAFPQKNADGTHRRAFDVTPGASLRWAWTVAGNAVVFAVEDVRQYA
jgi:hypothetical protein